MFSSVHSIVRFDVFINIFCMQAAKGPVIFVSTLVIEAGAGIMGPWVYEFNEGNFACFGFIRIFLSSKPFFG